MCLTRIWTLLFDYLMNYVNGSDVVVNSVDPDQKTLFDQAALFEYSG